jgi:hypothetical protein
MCELQSLARHRHPLQSEHSGEAIDASVGDSVVHVGRSTRDQLALNCVHLLPMSHFRPNSDTRVPLGHPFRCIRRDLIAPREISGR